MSSRPSTHPFLNTLSLSTPLLQHTPSSTPFPSAPRFFNTFLLQHHCNTSCFGTPLLQHSLFLSTPSFSTPSPSELPLLQHSFFRSTRPYAHSQHSPCFSTPSFSTPSPSELPLLQHSFSVNVLTHTLNTPPSLALPFSTPSSSTLPFS